MNQQFEFLSKRKSALVRSLAQRKKRRELSSFLAEGKRLVEDGLASGAPIEFIYGTEEALASITIPAAVETFRTDPSDSDLFLTEHSQGIGAVVSMRDLKSVDDILDMSGPLLYLDRISDPGNAGTIIRTADWFGSFPLLFSRGSVDPWNPKSVRGTMGGIYRSVLGIDASAEQLLTSGRPVYLLDMDGDILLGRNELDRNGLFVIGSEAEGAAEELRAVSTGCISIPGNSRGESLNAAMAATLLCWELFQMQHPITRSGPDILPD